MYRDLKTYITEFNKAYGNKQKAIVAQLDDTANQIELFIELVFIATEADLDILKSKAEDIIQTSQVTMRCLDVDPVSARSTNNASYFNLPEFPAGPSVNASKICRRHSDTSRKLKYLLLELPDVMVLLANASSIELFQTKINMFTFELLLANLGEVSSTFSSCYGDFITLMLDIEKWYSSLTLITGSHSITEPSVEYEIDVSDCLTYSIYPVLHL